MKESIWTFLELFSQDCADRKKVYIMPRVNPFFAKGELVITGFSNYEAKG